MRKTIFCILLLPALLPMAAGPPIDPCVLVTTKVIEEPTGGFANPYEAFSVIEGLDVPRDKKIELYKKAIEEGAEDWARVLPELDLPEEELKELYLYTLEFHAPTSSTVKFADGSTYRIVRSPDGKPSLVKVASRRNTAGAGSSGSTVDPLLEALLRKGIGDERVRMFYDSLMRRGGGELSAELRSLVARIPGDRFTRSLLSPKILGFVIRHFNRLGGISAGDAEKLLKLIVAWDDQSLAGLGKIYADAFRTMRSNRALSRNDAIVAAMEDGGMGSRAVNGLKKCLLF